jgi:hypothetical protein
MTGRGPKIKINLELLVFNEEWFLDYLVIYSGKKKICLICKENIPAISV